MADNYLEKHYEEYQKRKAIWEKTKKYKLKTSKLNSANEKDFVKKENPSQQ